MATHVFNSDDKTMDSLAVLSSSTSEGVLATLATMSVPTHHPGVDENGPDDSDDEEDDWKELAKKWVRRGEKAQFSLKKLATKMKADKVFTSKNDFLSKSGSTKDVLRGGLSEAELDLFHEELPKKIRGIHDEHDEKRMIKKKMVHKIDRYFYLLKEYLFPTDQPDAAQSLERKAYRYHMKTDGVPNWPVGKKHGDAKKRAAGADAGADENEDDDDDEEQNEEDEEYTEDGVKAVKMCF